MFRQVITPAECGGDYKDNFAGHAELYIDQTSDESFKNTTEPFKQAIVKKTAEYILSAKKREGANSTELISKFNINNKASYSMTYEQEYIQDDKNKIVDTKYFIKIRDKDNNLVSEVEYNEKLTKD